MYSFEWLDWLSISPTSSIVLENCAFYSHFDVDSASPQIMLWIRGPQGKRSENVTQIHDLGSIVVLDCGLHLESDQRACQTPSTKVNYHPLKVEAHQKHSDVIHHLYSLGLVPLASVVVFVEEEFNSRDDIMNILAYWTTLGQGQTRSSRPLVLLASNPNTCLSQDVEFYLTTEILNSFNPVTDPSANKARQLWQASFKALESFHLSLNNLPKICQEVGDALIQADIPNPLPATSHLPSIISTALSQYAASPGNVVSPSSLLRKYPVCSRLKSQVHRSLTLGFAEKLAIDVATAFLLKDAHDSELGLSKCHPEHIFIGNYSSIAEGLTVQLKHELQENFVKVLNDLENPVTFHRKVLSNKDLDCSLAIGTICRRCFTEDPQFKLSCSHRFCQPCVIDMSDQSSSAHRDLPFCKICNALNNHDIITRPPTAGLRILKINAIDRKEYNLAEDMLRVLKDHLLSPLFLHFDLVIGSEEFGRHLVYKYFCSDQVKKGISVDHPSKDMPERLDLQSNKVIVLTDCERSVVKELLPNVKVDISFSINGTRTREDLGLMSKQLLAALFYMVPSSDAEQVTNKERSVVHCRVPGGKDLRGLIYELQEVMLEYRKHRNRYNISLVPEELWTEVRAGKDFKLSVDVDLKRKVYARLRHGIFGRLDGFPLSNRP